MGALPFEAFMERRLSLHDFTFSATSHKFPAHQRGNLNLKLTEAHSGPMLCHVPLPAQD